MVLANLVAHSPHQIATKIMLPNEEFALACRQYYAEEGSIVDKRNGQFAHSPYPDGMGDTGYYLLWEHHQHQGLLQSRDVGRCCFFTPDARKWLLECNYFPENYFDLWDIYDEYKGENILKTHLEKDEQGRSQNTMRLHSEKDGGGRSVMGVRNAERLHAEKDEFGRSVQGVKNAERLHAEKDEDGKSLNAKKAGKAAHTEKDEDGKSVNGRKISKLAHAKKDEFGRSVLAMQNVAKLNKDKDERGKSIAPAKGAQKTLSQVWESTVDGYRSNPGGVATHNKANGWDPDARIQIS